MCSQPIIPVSSPLLHPAHLVYVFVPYREGEGEAQGQFLVLHLMLVQEVRDALRDVVKELGLYQHGVRSGWDRTKVPLGDVMTFDPRAYNCMDLSEVCFLTGLRPCTSLSGEPCRLWSPEQRDTAQDWLASSLDDCPVKLRVEVHSWPRL